MWKKIKEKVRYWFKDIKISYCLIALLGSAILAAVLYNVHSISGITEGGVFGLTLLLEYWWDISPAITSAICNVLCYVLGYKILGKNFIIYSLVSTGGFSMFYGIFEQFPRIYEGIAEMPFLAATIGAIFIGLGSGLCVLIGGAPSGDDALAMSLSRLTKAKIQWVYLISDLSVLLLSLSYIPFSKIIYSLYTVVLSGQVIGWVVKIPLPGKKKEQKALETEAKRLPEQITETTLDSDSQTDSQLKTNSILSVNSEFQDEQKNQVEGEKQSNPKKEKETFKDYMENEIKSEKSKENIDKDTI